MSVLLGNGNGTFRTTVDYAVGSLPDSVATSDFNGDDRPDLVIANYYTGTIDLFLNECLH